MEEKYLKPKEVEEILKITSRTLYNWRKIGLIKYIQISSRKYLYSEESIKELIKKHSC